MKIIPIISLFLACCLHAQEPLTIKVLGRAMHIDSTPDFYGSVTVSGTYSSYPEDAMTLDQMKGKYNNALQKNNLSLDMLTENQTAYIILGHEKEGTIYEYKSSSFEEFSRFLNTKSRGVQRLTYGATVVIEENEAQNLMQDALQNARSKAMVIAKIQGKNHLEIVQVTDNNQINIPQQVSVYYDQPLGAIRYDIEVIFTLK